jgi:hypothetical protein
MKTLAEVKRALDVGASVTITHFRDLGPGDSLVWGGGERTLPFTREVAVRQGNAVAFTEPLAHGGKSWLYWPKASEIAFADDGAFTINGVTYKLAG